MACPYGHFCPVCERPGISSISAQYSYHWLQCSKIYMASKYVNDLPSRPSSRVDSRLVALNFIEDLILRDIEVYLCHRIQGSAVLELSWVHGTLQHLLSDLDFSADPALRRTVESLLRLGTQSPLTHAHIVRQRQMATLLKRSCQAQISTPAVMPSFDDSTFDDSTFCFDEHQQLPTMLEAQTDSRSMVESVGSFQILNNDTPLPCSDTEDTENSSDSSNDSNLSELDPYIDDEAASKIPADMSFMKDVSILVPSLVIPDFPLYKGELLPSRCTRTLKDSAHVRSALQSIKTHHNLTTSAVSTLTQFAKMIWHAAQLASDSNAPRLPLKLDSNGYRSSKSGLPTPGPTHPLFLGFYL